MKDVGKLPKTDKPWWLGRKSAFFIISVICRGWFKSCLGLLRNVEYSLNKKGMLSILTMSGVYVL